MSFFISSIVPTSILLSIIMISPLLLMSRNFSIASLTKMLESAFRVLMGVGTQIIPILEEFSFNCSLIDFI